MAFFSHAARAIRDGPAGRQADGPVSMQPRRQLGRTLVEVVRLVIVALLASAGWEVASRTGPNTAPRLVLGIVIGSGVGYVVGGMFGRTTASAASELEREFRRIPAADALAGTLGLILGLVPAALLSIPLFHLPPVAAFPTAVFVYSIGGVLGYRLGRAKSDELFALVGVKPRAAGTLAGEVAVLDTSVLLDDRIEALIRMGFVSGSLLVTRSVVDELQRAADASEPGRRGRGRRALDRLIALRRDPAVDIILVEDETTRGDEDVDAQLVRLTRSRSGVLITNDSNLARVAKALEVPVRSIDALAHALRPPVSYGDRLEVRMVRAGRDAGQAVGYLDDGTMIVVEDAVDSLGQVEPVTVTNVLQTSNGRLVFARRVDGVADDGSDVDAAGSATRRDEQLEAPAPDTDSARRSERSDRATAGPGRNRS